MPTTPLEHITARFTLPHDIEQAKQRAILALKEDEAVIHQTLKSSFEINTDGATHVLRLMLASLQLGTFQVKNTYSTEWELPINNMSAANYLAHGSRLLFDLAHLSQQDKQEFYQIMDSANFKGRTSTHTLVRAKDQLIEGKSKLAGLKHSMTWDKERNSPHRGVNIAIGGEGETNMLGNVITANGYSGHLFAYFTQEKTECMLGVEQTAPLGMYTETHIKGAQHGADVFGNKHSLVGASDKATAFGTLYFDEPRFTKCYYLARGALPPQKYGGMKITIYPEQWRSIKERMYDLRNGQIISDPLLSASPASSAAYQHAKKSIKLPPTAASYFNCQIDNMIEAIYSLIANYDNRLAQMKKPTTEKMLVQTKRAGMIEVIEALHERDLIALKLLAKDKRLNKGITSNAAHLIKDAIKLLSHEAAVIDKIAMQPPLLRQSSSRSQLSAFDNSMEAIADKVQTLYLEYYHHRMKQPNHPAIIAKQRGLQKILRAIDEESPEDMLTILMPLTTNAAFIRGKQTHRCLDVLNEAITLIKRTLDDSNHNKVSL